MKSVSIQFVKYLGAAGAGYTIDLGTMIFLKEVVHLHYLVSAAIGFTLGLIVIYILSSRYVFGKSKVALRRNEFMLFTLIGVVGLSILSLLMWALTDGLRMGYITSKILATVAVYLWNFFARRSLYHN